MTETTDTQIEEKPKRTRRAAAKAVEGVEQVAEKPKRTRRTKAAEESAEPLEAAPKKRAPRTKKTEEAPAPETLTSEAASAATSVVVDGSEAADAPVEKPKRTRRTAKKPAKVEEEPVVEAAAPAESVAEEKPKRTRRTKAAGESAETTEAAPKKRAPRAKKAAEEAAVAEAKAAEPVHALSEAEAAALIAQYAVEAAAEAAKAAQASEKAEEAPTDSAKSTGDSAQPAEAVEASSDKPRRTHRTRKAEATDENKAVAAPAKEEASKEEASQAKKQDAQAKSAKQDKQAKNQKNDRRERERERRERRSRRQQQQREIAPSVTLEELTEWKVADLRAKAAELELDVAGMKKAELIPAVYAATMKAEGFMEVEGVLDILTDGYGFLRTQGYLPGEHDVYVGLSTIRRNGLRRGDLVKGQTRPTRENEKYAAIQKITSVNGKAPEELGQRVKFADLTPVYPDERLVMEHGKNTITARVIDLTAPIGKGQRGLIVSPPKAGKTTVLKDIAAAISANNPEVHLICLLVDERPEEVTDMQRSIHGEVVSSTFDMPCENHIAVAELVIERAKRLVEDGRDVVILLDSITRLARAYNLAQPASGRILSGGVDSTALYPPKRFLGAARNIENGGSLTILASALIDTGSKMDEVIFEEFKGTGNMELKLDRSLADRRVFPAIDPVTSGTRKEDLLLDPQSAPLIWAVRRILANMNNTERAMDMLIKSLKQTNNNVEFLMRTAKKAQHDKTADSFEL